MQRLLDVIEIAKSEGTPPFGTPVIVPSRTFEGGFCFVQIA